MNNAWKKKNHIYWIQMTELSPVYGCYSCFCPWQSTYRLTLTECTWGRPWLATKCPYWKMLPSYAVLLLAKWTSDVNLSIMTSAADDVQSTVGQPKLIPHSWQRRQIVITTPSLFSILIIVQWHCSWSVIFVHI